jgi:hypothetical protein
MFYMHNIKLNRSGGRPAGPEVFILEAAIAGSLSECDIIQLSLLPVTFLRNSHSGEHFWVWGQEDPLMVSLFLHFTIVLIDKS